jgi:hypothetical protein
VNSDLLYRIGKSYHDALREIVQSMRMDIGKARYLLELTSTVTRLLAKVLE